LLDQRKVTKENQGAGKHPASKITPSGSVSHCRPCCSALSFWNAKSYFVAANPRAAADPAVPAPRKFDVFPLPLSSLRRGGREAFNNKRLHTLFTEIQEKYK